ncbi:hypothetical protein KI387_025145, partial [Taxus chinensis]
DNPELPDAANHVEEEKVLGKYQMEKSACMFIHDEIKVFSFLFGDEYDLSHAIHGGTRPSCDEPVK